MLILFSESFHGHVEACAADSRFLAAVENLALGHREGKHVVLGPATVLDALSKLAAFSEQARGTYRQIKLDKSDLDPLRGHVTRVVVVEPLAEVAIRREPVGEHVHYHVPYGFFDDSGRVQPCLLLAENGDDASIYERAAAAYLFSLGSAKGLETRFRPHGAGGSTMVKELPLHAAHALTLCIVDGDRKWPSAPLGDTAAQAEDALAKVHDLVAAEVWALPGREIENILRGALVLAAFDERRYRELRASCMVVDQLGFLGAADPLFHLDLKKGLRRYDVDHAADPAERAFLGRVFDHHRSRVEGPPNAWCGDEPECSNRDQCRCVLFNGLGTKFVANAAQRLSTRSPEQVADLLFAGAAAATPL